MHSIHLGWIATPLVAACATPQPVELRTLDASAALASRDDPARLEEVVEELRLAPSVLSLPSEDERARPDQRGFWLLRALAWSPEVRAARRAWRAAGADASSAGAPGPISVQATDHEFGGDDTLVEAVAVLDLVGLLGLGPSRAARQRARAGEAVALGRLELAAWDAWLEVERARIRCVAAVGRVQALEALARDARADLRRVTILERNGRIGAAPAEAARAAVLAVDRRASLAADELTGARAALARAAGIPAGSSDLVAVGAGPSTATHGESQELAPLDLVERAPGWLAAERDGDTLPRADAHPRLRVARLEFAALEADVRVAAAGAWPGIGLGPHAGFPSGSVLDSTTVGAVMRLSLPFPSSWRGRLEAAIERRDAAVEAYEDLLHALCVDEAEGLERLAAAERRAADPTRAVTAATEASWRAARAAFTNARAPVAEWIDALARSAERATWRVDDAERRALAALEVVAARGPLAGPFRAASADRTPEVTP